MSKDESKTEPVKEGNSVEADVKDDDASDDTANNKEEGSSDEGTAGDEITSDGKQTQDEGDTKMPTDDKEDGKSESKDDGDGETESKKKEAPAKKKYTNWPLHNIKEPHANDVMYGRGGGTNHHPGNKRYRKIVEDRKLDYVNSKRLDKPLVALEIIREWRGQDPPGRFLKLDEKTGLWSDVGDKKAREKTSQALREKAPLIRKQQEEERIAKDGDNSESSLDDKEKKVVASEKKTTRFVEGTKTETKQVRKAVLARDHSLGREILGVGESVSLDGFSWQEPFQGNKRPSYPGTTGPSTVPASTQPLQSNVASTAYPPAGRNSSHGSLGMTAPHHGNVSVGGPPPPPDYYGRSPSDDRMRQFSNGRIESWGSNNGSTPAPYIYPPPPTALAQGQHQRSGSWNSPPPPLPHGVNHQRSGSWNGAREHSLSFNPLANASINQPANQSAFNSDRSGSGTWEPLGVSDTKVPPPMNSYGPGHRAAPAPVPYQPTSPRTSITPQSHTTNPQNPYNIDLNIAKSWSGGEVNRSWSGEQPHQPQHMRQPWSMTHGGHTGMTTGTSTLDRPATVKRETSHQNENYETKPMVKKVALNRDNSMASNRLKKMYVYDHDHDMSMLSNNFEQQSSLGTSAVGGFPTAKPHPLGSEERMSTLDNIAMDLMARPQPLLEDNRTSTIDALGLDLYDDPVLRRADLSRESTMEEEINDLKRGLPKPGAVTLANRLSTTECLELFNAPIAEDRLARQQRRTESSMPAPIDLTKEPSSTDAWLARA